MIHDEIIKDPYLTNKEIARRTGIDRTQVSHRLAELRKKGIVEIVYEGKRRKLIVKTGFNKRFYF